MKLKLLSLVILSASLLLPTVAFAEEINTAGLRFTPGRFLASLDAMVGLTTAIVAARDLARSKRPSGATNRNVTVATLVVGAVVAAYALLHVTIFPTGFGTGGGRAGAIVAFVLGLTTVALSAITLARLRRSR